MSNEPTTPSNRTLEHRIFRSDSKLSPAEINQLLGIKSTIPAKTGERQEAQSSEAMSVVLRLAIVTVFLTTSVLLVSMYQMKIGPFYEHEAIASGSLE